MTFGFAVRKPLHLLKLSTFRAHVARVTGVLGTRDLSKLDLELGCTGSALTLIILTPSLNHENHPIPFLF